MNIDYWILVIDSKYFYFTYLNIKKLWGGTFHHIANRILRRQAHILGYDNNFSILDQQDSKELLNTCIADLGLKTNEKRFPQGGVLQDIISLSVNTQREIDDIIAERYPFFYELIDEIKKVALHYQKRKKKSAMMDFDDLSINLLTREVYRRGKHIDLSAKEYSLLEFLTYNAGRALNRATISEHVWHYDFDRGTNFIDVYINRLRNKIDEGYQKRFIHTVRGYGYMFKP